MQLLKKKETCFTVLVLADDHSQIDCKSEEIV